MMRMAGGTSHMFHLVRELGCMTHLVATQTWLLVERNSVTQLFYIVAHASFWLVMHPLSMTKLLCADSTPYFTVS